MCTCVDEAGPAEAGHGGLHELGGQGACIGVQGLHPCQLPTFGTQLYLRHNTLVIWVQVPSAACHPVFATSSQGLAL